METVEFVKSWIPDFDKLTIIQQGTLLVEIENSICILADNVNAQVLSKGL